MASGYGLNGGPNRCYQWWQEFQACFKAADKPKECAPQANDYLECLHGFKETARALTIKNEYMRRERERLKQNAQQQTASSSSSTSRRVQRLNLIEQAGLQSPELI